MVVGSVRVEVKADGEDITSRLDGRVVSVRVIDALGYRSDELELVLRADGLALPESNATLSVRMGYLQDGLADMGQWVVQRVISRYPPAIVTTTARALVPASARGARRRTLGLLSFGQLVETVAGAAGAVVRIDEALASVPIGWVSQVGETDAELLARYAEQIGAIAKPAGGVYVVTPAELRRTPSGEALPELTPAYIDGELTVEGRWSIAAAVARWRNGLTGEMDTVRVGDETGDADMLPDIYASSELAERAAAAAVERARAGDFKLRMSCVGDTSIIAGCRVRIDQPAPGLVGSWQIEKVTHTLSAGGYVCEIEGNRWRA